MKISSVQTAVVQNGPADGLAALVVAVANIPPEVVSTDIEHMVVQTLEHIRTGERVLLIAGPVPEESQAPLCLSLLDRLRLTCVGVRTSEADSVIVAVDDRWGRDEEGSPFPELAEFKVVMAS